MREAFREILSGWTLYEGIEDLTDRIERAAAWSLVNGLEPDERETVRLMIECQIARGLDERGPFDRPDGGSA